MPKCDVNHVEGVTPRQEQAIAALVTEPTVEKAALVCGTAQRTIYRWLRETAFVAAYRNARREAFRQAISLTQRYTPLAIQTLAKIMLDSNASEGARVAASVAMLKFGRDSMELEDLGVRLEEVERRLAFSAKGEGGAGDNGAGRGSDHPTIKT